MGSPRTLYVFALILSLVASSAVAQVSFQEEYTKLVNGGESISTYDGGLFGDSVSLATGAVEFTATDVSLPGNNAIPVAFGRRRSVETGREPNFMLGDWDIDIPFMEGVFGDTQGWVVNTASPTQRCSSPASIGEIAPPNLFVGNLGAITPRQYWQGIHLQVPGQGRQEVLLKSPSVASPNDGQTYQYITSGFWQIRCAPTLASGQLGEGFVARSPDGMTYTFDWMVTSSYPAVQWPRSGGNYAAPRVRVRLYPTTIVDRHGSNRVTYTWLGDRLQSITSSDGRALSIHYNTQGRIDTVKDDSTPQRTWTYSYSAGSLQSVLLPDNSQWQLDFAIGIGSVNYDTSTSTTGYDTALNCNWMRRLLANEKMVTITHPSGAIGTFKFDVKRHGRANVDSLCNRDDALHDQRNNYPDTPARFDTWSLMSKRIEGPGLPGPSTNPPAPIYEWTYSYLLPTGNFTATSCSPACATSKSVEMTAPDGSRTTYTYGIDFGRTDNQLQSVRTVSASGAQIRLENYAYVLDVLDGKATPFPDRIGKTPQTYADDSYFGEALRPQKQRTILQGGVTFSSNTTRFDVWAYPVSVTKSSVLGSKTEVSVYEHNLAKWVLGQLKTLTVDGQLASQVDYSPTTALPIRTYAFGKQLQTLAYYDLPGQDGNLRSVTDGNTHEIRFSDYHRGIARRIDYPTGKWKTAEVNNQGSITSVTDELFNTTYYDYLPNGRLWKIRYPSGDTPAWNEKVFAFEQVGSAYGIGAGHWRQTVTQGNASKTTDYDALWRPLVVHEVDTVAGSGRFTVRRFDYAGRDAFTSYPSNTLGRFDSVTTGTTSAYDALGRLISTSQTSELGAINTTVTYEPSGFKKTVRNGLNQATTYSYKAFDEPTEDWPTLIVAPESVSVSIDRPDAFGKPRSITRSGTLQSNGVALPVSATRSYVYDSYAQLCKTIEPEIGATVIDYDGAGNVVWTAAGLNLLNTNSCDRNAVGVAALRSDRTYDALNRPLDTTFADGSPAIRRTYWDDGQLHTIRTEGTNSANNTLWSYDYNNRRLPTTETLALDGRVYNLENRYTANGHLRSLVYPDLVEVDYAPNALGESTRAGNALKNYASSVTTWPNGAIKGFTYGNGVVHTLSQNSRGMPLRSQDSMNVLDDTYGYDANSNVRSIADAISGATRTMQYDDLDRLETMNSAAPWSNSTYVYDALDNIRSSTVGTRAYTHTYSASNLLEALKVGGTTVVGYNYLRGNLTQRGGQTFIFDQANRLVSKAGERPKTDEAYAYDGHGRRVKVVRPADGSTRHMLYSQSGQLRFEANLATNTLTDYIYLGGSLVAREESASAVTAPPPPVVTAPANNTTGTYTVTWSAPTATSYVFEENRGGTGWVVQSSGPATSILLTLHGNGVYQYRAKAYNAGGWSLYGAIVSTQVSGVTQPPAPGGIAASPNPSLTGTFEVRWPKSDGATLYRLWENANSNGWAPAPVFTGNALAFTVTGRGTGSYQYRVEACSAACSLPTAAVAVSVTVTAGLPGAPVLTVPSSSSTGVYQVSWTATGGKFFELQELGPGWAWVTLYSDQGLAQTYTRPAGTYAYRVRACLGFGCGDFGPVSTITVALVGVPPIPANLLATPNRNTTGITALTWDASTGATRYVLQRISNGGSPVIAYSGPGGLSNESGLAVGTHAYSVKACSGVLDTTCSAFSSATVYTRDPTGPVAPQPVTSITVTPASSADGTYTLSWVPATSGVPAAYYLIKESLDGTAPDCADPCRVDAPGTSWTFSGRGNGNYQYWVEACVPGACANSPTPATVVVEMPNAPGRPAFINTTETGCSATPRAVSLTWGAGSGATHYQIREINPMLPPETGMRIIDIPGTGTATTVISRNPGNEPTDFTYEVRALNGQNVASAWRGPVTVCVGDGGGNVINAPAVTTVRYLHTDALGSPVAETNEFGGVVKRTRYEPYGAPTDGVYVDGPGFTGHVTDAATGLTYMQQRYYDPMAGRFLSLDPVTASPGSFNRYWYANNNPYRFVDPDGRFSWEMFGDAFTLEGSVGMGLSAKASFGPLKASIGLGSMTYGGGVTLAPDAYAMQRVEGPSASIELFDSFGLGYKGSQDASFQGRRGVLYSEEKSPGGLMIGLKKAELKSEQGGSNAEISATLSLGPGRLKAGIDFGKIRESFRSDASETGSGAGFKGVFEVSGRIESNSLTQRLKE